MSAALTSPLEPPDAQADARRRRLMILTSVIVFCSVLTICFCTWVTVLVSRARAANAEPAGNTPASSVAPVQGSMCP